MTEPDELPRSVMHSNYIKNETAKIVRTVAMHLLQAYQHVKDNDLKGRERARKSDAFEAQYTWTILERDADVHQSSLSLATEAMVPFCQRHSGAIELIREHVSFLAEQDPHRFSLVLLENETPLSTDQQKSVDFIVGQKKNHPLYKVYDSHKAGYGEKEEIRKLNDDLIGILESNALSISQAESILKPALVDFMNMLSNIVENNRNDPRKTPGSGRRKTP